MRAEDGRDWENAVDVNGPRSKTDAQFLLRTMLAEWREVFERTLGRMERSYVSELIDARNRWAHQEAFTSDDAYRALDTVERLLQAISAGEQATEVGRMKHDLQRRRYPEEARRVTRRQTAQPLEGMPSGNLQAVAGGRDAASATSRRASTSRRSSPPTCTRCGGARRRTSTASRRSSSAARSSPRGCASCC